MLTTTVSDAYRLCLLINDALVTVITLGLYVSESSNDSRVWRRFYGLLVKDGKSSYLVSDLLRTHAPQYSQVFHYGCMWTYE